MNASTIVTDTLNKQGILAPGEHGYWRVWGADARHIRPDDLLLVRWTNADQSHEITEHKVLLVEEHLCGRRVLDTQGQTFLVGYLGTIVLLREGTKNTLA